MRLYDIKRIRKDHNVTQSWVAEKTGYDQGFISLMERGITSVPEQFIERLAQALGLTDLSKYEKYKTGTQAAKKEPTRSITDRLLTIIEEKDKQIRSLERKLRQLEKKLS